MIICNHISKFFDKTQALNQVDFSIRPGEVHALCGENGAGKSTLARILAGVVPRDGGTISIDDQEVQIDSPEQARALGIGIVFQELDLFEDLSIAENMLLRNPAMERFLVHNKQQDDWCQPYLAKVGLQINPRLKLGSQSIATAQLVAIARVLGLQAKYLLLDEPTSSLTEEAATRLLHLITELKKTGTGIVYVSHKMKEIFQIADRVTVLRDGELVSTKNAAETSIEETISLMVGRKVDLNAKIKTQPQDEYVLEVKNLRTEQIRDVNFKAKKGEVIGIAGLVGSGRSALGEALFGMVEWESGEVLLHGKPYRPKSPRSAIQQKFAYLPKDRRLQGLFLNTSIQHNASAAIIQQLSRLTFVDRGREKQLVSVELARTRTKAAGLSMPVNSLSGGNQQKVLLAKWLLPHPDVLFLDDPTRGIDIGAKADVYQIIENLAVEGKTILFVSSELTELLRCSHRILVMHEGKMMGILDVAEATQEKIMTMATGMADILEKENK